MSEEGEGGGQEECVVTIKVMRRRGGGGLREHYPLFVLTAQQPLPTRPGGSRGEEVFVFFPFDGLSPD